MFSKNKNNENNTCLISALDWGLGHTTRLFPVIRDAVKNGYNVIIACNSTQKKVFLEEFPDLRYEEIKGYDISYGKSGFFTFLKLLLQIPKILTRINFEKKWVARFLSGNKVDLIISDNRYGFRNKKVYSVFITHQLAPKSGIGKSSDRFMQFFLYQYINKFNECNVPDNENENILAGDLSHPLVKPKVIVKYIGALSRLKDLPPEWHSDPVPDKYILCILSGPEPQRSILENIILKDINNSPLPVIIVRGKPIEKNSQKGNTENIRFFSHLKGGELAYLINKAGIIISRSGYSTLMDLAVLNKNSITIPTPGQAEQEYLAWFHKEKYGRIYFKQEEFSFKEIQNLLNEKEAGVIKLK